MSNVASRASASAADLAGTTNAYVVGRCPESDTVGRQLRVRLRSRSASCSVPASSKVMSVHPYSFDGVICSRGDERYNHACVYLPDDLARELLRGRSRLRVRGEVNELPFAGAWQPSNGRYYLLLSRTMCRAGGFGVGDRIDVRCRIDDPDAVTVPAELERALVVNPEAMNAWQALTPGRRRGLAHLVASAKTAGTVAKRVDAVVDGLCGRAALPGPKASTSRRRRSAAGVRR